MSPPRTALRSTDVSSASPAVQQDQDEMLKTGNCTENICGLEAGCIQKSADKYACICPHEGRPTKDLRCPRKTVTDGPKPFPIIPHTDPANHTAAGFSSPPPPKDGAGRRGGDESLWSSLSGLVRAHGTASVLFLVLCLAAITIIAVFYLGYRRRLRLRMARKSSLIQMNTPVVLSKGVIDADRFAANPVYLGSGSDSQTFTIISHDSISFANGHCIGEGCFGKVYKGELRRPDGSLETVAVKVLKDSASKEAEEAFMREVKIMSSFQHKNILCLLGVALKEIGRNSCMVFEFMPYGDLIEVLRSNSKFLRKPDPKLPRLTKESLLLIATQIACGMKYLASQHFVHRDLACRNCLVGNNLIVKIADFGMSRDINTCDYYKIGGSRLLPVRWMSPESVTYGRFTVESDVWSFGVVLWEIYSLGKQPYFGHTNEEVIGLINRGILLIPPEDCPPTVADLMRSCWRAEPKERPAFAEIYGRLSGSSPTLPRPPPFPVIPTVPEVEEYLIPTPRPPHDYLQTLPD